MFVNEKKELVNTPLIGMTSSIKQKKKPFKNKVFNGSLDLGIGQNQNTILLSSALDKLIRLTEFKEKVRIYRPLLSSDLLCGKSTTTRVLCKLERLGFIKRDIIRSKVDGKFVCELFVTVIKDRILSLENGVEYLKNIFKEKVHKAGEKAKKIFNKLKKKKVENTQDTQSNKDESDDIHYSSLRAIKLTSSNEELSSKLNSFRITREVDLSAPPAPVQTTADAGLKIAFKEEGSVDTLVIDTQKGDETEIISNQQGGIASDVSFNCTETGSVQRVEGEVIESDIDDENRCVRVINDENAKGQKTTLSVDVDLTDRHKQIMKRYLIHSDHYETIFEQYCSYWFDVAEGKKAQKKNWHLTFVKWVINAVNWDTNEKLKKPMSREEKKAEFDYWDLLAKENQIPELYSMSLGMTIFYHKKLERMKYYDIIGYLPYTSGSIESFVEYAQKNPLRSKIVEAMGGEREEAEVTYDSWFGKCEHQPDNTSYDNEQTKFSVLKAPNAFMRDQINNRFRKVIDSLNLIIE